MTQLNIATIWEADRLRKPEAIPPYDLSRRVEFFNYEEQLDMLWHDIDEGRLPGKETSKWYAHIKAVKEEHPKP